MKTIFMWLIAKMTKTPLYRHTDGDSWLIKGHLYWAIKNPCKDEWIAWNGSINDVQVTSAYMKTSMKRIG